MISLGSTQSFLVSITWWPFPRIAVFGWESCTWILWGCFFPISQNTERQSAKKRQESGLLTRWCQPANYWDLTKAAPKNETCWGLHLNHQNLRLFLSVWYGPGAGILIYLSMDHQGGSKTVHSELKTLSHNLAMGELVSQSEFLSQDKWNAVWNGILTAQIWSMMWNNKFPCKSRIQKIFIKMCSQKWLTTWMIKCDMARNQSKDLLKQGIFGLCPHCRTNQSFTRPKYTLIDQFHRVSNLTSVYY